MEAGRDFWGWERGERETIGKGQEGGLTRYNGTYLRTPVPSLQQPAKDWAVRK